MSMKEVAAFNARFNAKFKEPAKKRIEFGRFTRSKRTSYQA